MNLRFAPIVLLVVLLGACSQPPALRQEQEAVTPQPSQRMTRTRQPTKTRLPTLTPWPTFTPSPTPLQPTRQSTMPTSTPWPTHVGAPLPTAATPYAIELIGQTGGVAAQSWTIDGSYLYGLQHELVVWDLSDPAAPALAAHYPSSRAQAVAVDGDLVYLLDSEAGLHVLQVEP